MFVSHILFLAIGTSAANILLSNDDGWAEINIRTFYDSLTASKNSVLVSAPAIDRSGTGSSDQPPQQLGSTGCEFNSCPTNSPATGSNASNPRLNYVNSYPVTSVKYGLTNLSSQILGSAPDIVVAGPNVGSNLGVIVLFSGTVGAASYGATQGFPAIAFSGGSGQQTSWAVNPVPAYAEIYASLSTNVTNTVLASARPFLPNGTFLNVNYPTAGEGTQCTDESGFRFVLSTINDRADSTVQICNSTKLPTESTVVNTQGCFASISVGNASNKADASLDAQTVVLDKLRPILSCLDGGSVGVPTINNTSPSNDTTGSAISSTAISMSGASARSAERCGLFGAFFAALI